MAKIFLEQTDYNTNKTPRLPICICIDVSSKVSAINLTEITTFINDLSNHILNNIECASKVQLCVVAFANKTEIVSGFKAVDATPFTVTGSEEQPDLDTALRKCADLFNAQIETYREKGISYYLPELLLISSGVTTTDITETANRLRNAQNSKYLSLMPFKIGEAPAIELEKLTESGRVYTIEHKDFSKLFDCMKSGIELLSASSAAACNSLESQMVGWEQFFKKDDDL